MERFIRYVQAAGECQRLAVGPGGEQVVLHGGCGKTSVAEMLLFTTGAVARQGKIEEGTTALDYEPEEIKRRGSTQPGLATFLYNKNRHFLLDIPGDGSFNGDLPHLLRAVDAVVFVVDAVDGVKPLTKKLWGEVAKLNLPAILFINKMDRDRADFDMPGPRAWHMLCLMSRSISRETQTLPPHHATSEITKENALLPSDARCGPLGPPPVGKGT